MQRFHKAKKDAQIFAVGFDCGQQMEGSAAFTLPLLNLFFGFVYEAGFSPSSLGSILMPCTLCTAWEFSEQMFMFISPPGRMLHLYGFLPVVKWGSSTDSNGWGDVGMGGGGTATKKKTETNEGFTEKRRMEMDNENKLQDKEARV